MLGMKRIKLYSQDYSTVLLTTDDDAVANQFLRASGEDSLPMVVDFGNSWKSRWGGRIVLHEDSTISTINSDFLHYMLMPTNPFKEQS